MATYQILRTFSARTPVVDSLAELERLLEEWITLRKARQARGNLRPGRAEVEIFCRIEPMLESLPPEQREAMLLGLAPGELCECGHPRGHHDGEEGCFHVIGCATSCGCRRWQDRRDQ